MSGVVNGTGSLPICKNFNFHCIESLSSEKVKDYSRIEPQPNVMEKWYPNPGPNFVQS